MFHTGPHLGPLEPQADGTERLGADDMATRREGEFLAAALARQRAENGAARHAPGVCAWCCERCQPLAIYCNRECQADHEADELVRRRQGLQRGGARGA